MDLQLKEQIKKVMVDYLTTKGFPNISDDQIFMELKPMWLKLEESGLLQPGMNFQAFLQIAQVKRQEAQMSNMFGGHFEDILKNFMGR